MKILDLLYWSWMKILDNTVYIYKNNKSGFTSKEHAFLLVFLFHGLNLYNFLSWILIKYWGKHLDFYLIIGLVILVYILGYILYFGKFNRYKKIKQLKISVPIKVLSISLSIAYAVFSGVLMFKIGDYIKDMNINLI
jgi:hypothetical protein